MSDTKAVDGFVEFMRKLNVESITLNHASVLITTKYGKRSDAFTTLTAGIASLAADELTERRKRADKLEQSWGETEAELARVRKDIEQFRSSALEQGIVLLMPVTQETGK